MHVRRHRSLHKLLVITCLAQITASGLATEENPPLFANTVVDYQQGTDPAFGFTNPNAALGPPTQFTGGTIEPMVASLLNPAWRPNEIVSIGQGGSLTLAFSTPVENHPDNPYGIDLLIFGNAFFDADGDAIAAPAICYSEGGTIELSTDGETWFTVENTDADGLFPTIGYADAHDPFATTPGNTPTDPTRPVDPTIYQNDFAALAYIDALQLYKGSAGGTGIDISTVGLESVSYIRISNPTGSGETPEIDAVADVRHRKPGDANLDDIIDTTDLLELLANWGPAHPVAWHVDFDNDATIAVGDLLILLANWSSP